MWGVAFWAESGVLVDVVILNVDKKMKKIKKIA